MVKGSKGKDLSYRIAREMAIKKELSEPMKRTHAELKRGLPPFTNKRTTPLNRERSDKVDKQGDVS